MLRLNGGTERTGFTDMNGLEEQRVVVVARWPAWRCCRRWRQVVVRYTGFVLKLSPLPQQPLLTIGRSGGVAGLGRGGVRAAAALAGGRRVHPLHSARKTLQQGVAKQTRQRQRHQGQAAPPQPPAITNIKTCEHKI